MNVKISYEGFWRKSQNKYDMTILRSTSFLDLSKFERYNIGKIFSVLILDRNTTFQNKEAFSTYMCFHIVKIYFTVTIFKVYKFSKYTSFQNIQVFKIYKFSKYTSFQSIQVFKVYKFSKYRSFQSIQVFKV